MISELCTVVKIALRSTWCTFRNNLLQQTSASLASRSKVDDHSLSRSCIPPKEAHQILTIRGDHSHCLFPHRNKVGKFRSVLTTVFRARLRSVLLV